MDESTYSNVLGGLKLDLQEDGIDNFILQDDNLSSHRASGIEDVKNTLEMPTIPSWPSNSLDLSPIENIWAIWKERVYARKPRNLEELERIAFSEWENLDPRIIKNLYESIPNRLSLLIKAKGRRIRY